MLCTIVNLLAKKENHKIPTLRILQSMSYMCKYFVLVLSIIDSPFPIWAYLCSLKCEVSGFLSAEGGGFIHCGVNPVQWDVKHRDDRIHRGYGRLEIARCQVVR